MSTASPRRPFQPQKIELGKLFDKQPPHALEAEAALLGSMILDGKVAGDVVQIIKGEDDFYKPAHSAIYKVLVDLYDNNIPVDMVQLNQKLRDRQQLEQVGGLDYLISLAESVPTSAAADYYARIVRDKATLRKLIEATGMILHKAYTSDEPVETLLDEAEQEVFKLAESKGDGSAADIGSLIQDVYSKLENSDGRLITGVDTGFRDLNELTSGFQNGEMIIVAARPSMGKTAVALNMAEHMAVVNKQPIAVFSLEMSKEQLAQRLLSSRSGVDLQRLRRHQIREEEWHALQEACADLTDAPLYIDDTAGLSLLGLRARARRMAARHHIKCVIVDYLQLMSGPKSDSREQEVSAISRGIKALARELNVPVICLSQLNRGPEGRDGHKPRMSDLRESGSIEQDADVIIMIHREDYYHRGEEGYIDNNVTELIITKQRNGPTDTVKVVFDGRTTRFHDMAHGAG